MRLSEVKTFKDIIQGSLCNIVETLQGVYTPSVHVIPISLGNSSLQEMDL